MSAKIDKMMGVDLDAVGAAYDLPREFSNDKSEPDSYYRERIRVVMAQNSQLQLPPMTLRDYFAAKAMQPVVAYLISQGGATDPEDAAPIAQIAYFMADAMLAERAK